MEFVGEMINANASMGFMVPHATKQMIVLNSIIAQEMVIATTTRPAHAILLQLEKTVPFR